MGYGVTVEGDLTLHGKVIGFVDQDGRWLINPTKLTRLRNAALGNAPDPEMPAGLAITLFLAKLTLEIIW